MNFVGAAVKLIVWTILIDRVTLTVKCKYDAVLCRIVETVL